MYIPFKTNVNGCIENRILILYGLKIHCIPISNFQPVFFYHFQRTASIDSLVDSMAITNQKRSLINTDLEEASERLQVRGHNVLFKVPVSNAVFDYYLTQALNIPLYYFIYVLLYKLLYYYQ